MYCNVLRDKYVQSDSQDQNLISFFNCCYRKIEDRPFVSQNISILDTHMKKQRSSLPAADTRVSEAGGWYLFWCRSKGGRMRAEAGSRPSESWTSDAIHMNKYSYSI